MQWLGFACGLFICLATAGSVIKSLVLPRGQTSRLAVLVGRRIVRSAFVALADRFDTYEAKDRILALSGPLSLLALLSVWMMSFFFGFALMLWPLVPDFGLALRESGSSMLTLGFAGTLGVGPTIVHFVAAATGLLVVALQVAYLPTLYSSFNRRETLVTLLQSRAGAPAWGPEIMMRAQRVNLLESLPDLYAEWERWAADVAESHTTYPVLVWFRSPHPLRSWVVALLAVMDSAALYLSLSPNQAPVEARLCLRMGFTALRDIADVVNIPYDPDPLPNEAIDLSFEEFEGGVERLADTGFEIERSAAEAWAHFQGWRVNYESICYRLADVTVAVPGPWSGPRTHLPELQIIPQRPPNRRPDDPHDRDDPKTSDQARWRV